MFLEYENKKTEEEILSKKINTHLVKANEVISDKKLIVGNNYEVMRSLLDDFNYAGKVDLVYIDPPFATNNTFRIGADRTSTVSSSHKDETAYEDILQGSDFIEFLRERVVLLRELMSNRASIYLHIDYKIGHYVKIMMDEVFGAVNFRNDITRIKCNPKNFNRKAYGNIRDLVLFYTKTKNYTWNEPRAPVTEEDIKRLCAKIDAKGRRYTTIPLHAPGETKNGPTGQPWRGMMPPKGRHWRCAPDKLEELEKQGLVEWSSKGVPRKIIYAEEKIKKGKKVQDIWEYKDPQYPTYPTQKNKDMLDMIVCASSDEGDLVMDCFAGSGTTIISANELGRDWIGIDESEQAIEVINKRLAETKNESLFQSVLKHEILKLEKTDSRALA
ncbi:MAG: site-specific DNA-methyltransferase [Planctomycetota bacterium]|nr:MAG: site-specific DNA-methyltransferase [Planctomycetota bacterium]